MSSVSSLQSFRLINTIDTPSLPPNTYIIRTLICSDWQFLDFFEEFSERFYSNGIDISWYLHTKSRHATYKTCLLNGVRTHGHLDLAEPYVVILYDTFSTYFTLLTVSHHFFVPIVRSVHLIRSENFLTNNKLCFSAWKDSISMKCDQK